jgi:thymidylate synthase (FAD)
MKVKLIASTTIDLRDTPWEEEAQSSPYADPDPDILAEFAGRACYQSWDRPNPATATNQTYLAHILEVDHGSVLEHASATFYVTGVSRSLTHELIRHRAGMAYSELSQRFVDVQNARMIMPPAITHEVTKAQLRAGWDAPALLSHINAAWDTAREAYDVIAQRLTSRGLTRKQAREAARAVMPSATETKIVVTGNMRAWRHVCKMRGSEHADAEIRQFAHEVLRQLKEIAPNTFQDM